MKISEIFCSFLNNPVYSDNEHLSAGISWLLRAQKISKNGGFSAFYFCWSGWAEAYPETTGYIIPTLLNYSADFKNQELPLAAERAADWLLSIQNKDGSFNGFSLDNPIAFDVGQIIFGLAAIYKFTGRKKYLDSLNRAADWLCKMQENGGYWQKTDYNNLKHVYSSRISWGLLEAYKITGKNLYKEKAEKNLNWILLQQEENGWFEYCSFFNDDEAVLHTIAYTIQGLLESGAILENREVILSAQKTANILLELNKKDILSGFYNKNWQVIDKSKCLTGLAQMAIIWLRLYEVFKKEDYLIESEKILNYLKSKQNTSGKNENLRGAISGSYPVWGKYFSFRYPNWAVKFFLDALLLHRNITSNRVVNFYQG
jgi:uncharacterized protein YyaL (SSP411 family)